MSFTAIVAAPLFLTEKELEKVHQRLTTKYKEISDSKLKELSKKRLKEAENRMQKLHAMKQASVRASASASASASAAANVEPDDIQRMLSALVPPATAEPLSFAAQFELKQVTSVYPHNKT